MPDMKFDFPSNTKLESVNLRIKVTTGNKIQAIAKERNIPITEVYATIIEEAIEEYRQLCQVPAAIREHIPNIILDESPLLSPAKYLIILKILEGTGDYYKTFLFELGNAVNRNHFMFNVKSNSKYYKIDISLDPAIAEGRLDPESIEEKRGLPFFEQFYVCQFPDEDEIDETGYRQLVTSDLIDSRLVDEIDIYEEQMINGR